MIEGLGRKSESVQALMTAAERARLEALAGQSQCSLSAVARACILRGLLELESNPERRTNGARPKKTK